MIKVSENTNNNTTYSVRHIYDILESYSAVDAGAYDQEQAKSYNQKTKRDVMRADFENCIVAKSDIDAAIDKLGAVPGRWLAYCHHITEDPAGYGLNPAQYKVAKFIQGYTVAIGGIVKELSQIA
jgi:hypothetical protein